MKEVIRYGRSGKVKTYTKRDVAQKVAELSSEKVRVAEKWVDHLFAALRKIITSADPELRIEIRDFGVFEVKRTKPKPKARNPRTGEIIFVPARRKTHFKPSKLLKRFLEQPLEQTDLIPPVPIQVQNPNGEVERPLQDSVEDQGRIERLEENTRD
ncbi:MAG: HU family DNA-binding protein [Bacteroidota bacterium]